MTTRITEVHPDTKYLGLNTLFKKTQTDSNKPAATDRKPKAVAIMSGFFEK